MPQSNDAELTELYTAAPGTDVENDEPNAVLGGPPSNTFDLRLQAVAGNTLGASGAAYTLRADCIDETTAERVASMSVGPVNQNFNNLAGNDWQQISDGSYKKEQTATINRVAARSGHVFRYVGSLVGANGDVVSFIESNKFIML
jgi:hypothetical protein